MEVNKLAERLVAYLEKRGGNITESYNDWLIACFSCVTLDTLGGRELFHRLSRLSGKYNEKECNKQYNACLKASHDCAPNIAPLLALSAQHGYYLKDDFAPRQYRQSTPPITYQVPPQPTAQPPVLRKEPSFSRTLMAVTQLVSDPNLKAIALTAFLTGLATLAPTAQVIYQGGPQHLHLYYCLVAPPASGKSELGKIAKLFDMVQTDLTEETLRLWDSYRSERKQAKPADREEIQKPPLKTLFLPADTSTAALMKTLKDNDENGLMWESELDTLTRNMKSEYGNFNDLLRNNWQSESIKSNRKKDRELITLNDPHFSLVCSGTPQQVPRFFGSAENGLFSRFLFGTLPPSLEWRDQFKTPKQNGDIAEIGRWLREFKTWASDVGRITFTEKQQKMHYEFWSQTNADYYALGGDELVGCVRRHGLAQLRLASLITLLQNWEQRDVNYRSEYSLECTSEAWKHSKELIEISLSATLTSYSLLSAPPKDTGSKKAQEREQILATLSGVFTLNDLPTGMSQSSKYRLLELWRNQGVITKTENGWIKKGEQ